MTWMPEVRMNWLDRASSLAFPAQVKINSHLIFTWLVESTLEGLSTAFSLVCITQADDERRKRRIVGPCGPSELLLVLVNRPS